MGFFLYRNMKFAHLADCHIGGWNQPALRQLGLDSFKKAVEICLQERVAFVLIAGDLFNTALPGIELVGAVAAELKKLKDENIEVYLIPGSHDFSPSGKTMLDVLEKSGLCVNVFRLENGRLRMTEDKTGVKLTGVLGLAAGLDKEVYKQLDFSEVEQEKGYKIFLLHTTIDEFKPRGMEEMAGENVASLPQHFQYYAAGHVHYRFDAAVGGGLLVYPGPTFPNNFKELEELKCGSFCIVEDGRMRRILLGLKEVKSFRFEVGGKNPKEVEEGILQQVQDAEDAIVLLRLEGMLGEGGLGDIDFKKIQSGMQRAYCVLKNTAGVSSKEFLEIAVEGSSVEEIESKIIEEHRGQLQVDFDERGYIEMLMKVLDDEKQEGEKNYDFENRIENNIVKALGIESIWG